MRHLARIALIATAIAGASAAGAYSVSPLRIAMTPSGPGAAQRLTITNSEAQPITVSFSALKNSVDGSGKLVATPAGSEMMVFPPRSVLAPGKSQTVQIRYTGTPSLAAGLYSVHVQQVPVNATQGEAQIKVATEFFVAALVQPKEAAAKVDVQGVARAADGTVTVTVVNSGTGIGRMSSGTWSAQTGSGATPVPADAFDYGDTAYILPGTTRTIRLSGEQATKLGPVSAMRFTANEG